MRCTECRDKVCLDAGIFSVNIRLLHAFHPSIFPSTFNWNAIRERSRYQEMSLLIYYHYYWRKVDFNFMRSINEGNWKLKTYKCNKHLIISISVCYAVANVAKIREYAREKEKELCRWTYCEKETRIAIHLH